jgi:peptidyl-prolyl cis-trans isomerase C
VKICVALLALSIPALFAQITPAPKITGAAPAPPPAASAPADANKVILTIGTTRMTQADYEKMVDGLPAQYQSYARGASTKRQFVETIVQMKLLSAQAQQLSLDKDPKLEEQIAFQRQSLMAQAMFEHMQQEVKVDDAQIQLYYDAHKNEYESLRAKHILIRVKGAPMPAAAGKPELTDEQALAKAQDIRKRLAAGEDFAALATAESDDTGSASKGGDLGEFHRGMMVPPFEQAAFALNVGDVSEPVKTPFGYHIIVVLEHKSKSLAEVKPDIEKALRPQEARKAVEAMRNNASVQIDDSFFGPPAPPPPAPSVPATPHP